jgi:succinate dehydrogenase/fumarate reductase flavoprotein subunit
MDQNDSDDSRPLVIDRSEVTDWAATADVIVVGYGMAGACAAIAAAEASVEVLVLERSSGCTGTTASAAGHFYLGGGTAVQTACGFADSAEDLARYLTAVMRDPDAAKIQAFSKGSAAHFDWLEAHGVPFDRSYFPTKAVIQSGRDCLIWTGNEKVWPFRSQARPAPRGHKVAFDGEEGGGALALNKLAESAGELGVDARFDMRVDALIVEDGVVVGVRARHFGAVVDFCARRGVVLATGGYGRNAAMMAEHLPAFTTLYIQGGPYEDGLGIRLGVAAGGVADHMENIFLTAPFYPPEQLVKGILVNRDGVRFVAEDSYHSRSSIAIAEQPDGIAYLIVDSDIFAYPSWSEQANQRLIDGFASVEEMAQGLELPAERLGATLSSYNQFAAHGEDPAFGKHPDWLKTLVPPFAAFDLSFGRAVYTGFTLGGLRVTANGEVVTEHGQSIPGLYAAGACASTLAQDSHGYASGLSLGESSFFGRQAGAHAAIRP